MPLRAWWTSHFRPRDVFALACLLSLAALCAAVWLGAPGEASARKDVVISALGVIAGVAGFYGGARTADLASDEAREARAALRDHERDLEEATALVAALQRRLAEREEDRKDG